MIQNYVRVGVLTPPIDKRHYTKDHLVLLALIDNLKTIFSLEEIKLVLEPIRNNPETFEDDIIKSIDVYNNYITMRKIALNQWQESLPSLLDNVINVVKDDGIKEDEKAKASAFIATLAIMAQTIAMKDVVDEIIKG
jgi:DNA-binding transcriptional MerR regulator